MTERKKAFIKLQQIIEDNFEVVITSEETQVSFVCMYFTHFIELEILIEKHFDICVCLDANKGVKTFGDILDKLCQS